MSHSNEFNINLSEESDRGAVLIVSAMIEVELVKLIKLRLVENCNLKKCGVSNFSSKIEMAFYLGIISEQSKELYNGLRTVRNEFAHSTDFLNLETDIINKQLEKIYNKHPKFTDDLEANMRQAIFEQGGSDVDVEEIMNKTYTFRKKFDYVFKFELERLKIAENFIKRISPLITAG